MRGAAWIESAVELHAPGSPKLKPSVYRNVALGIQSLQMIVVVELMREGNRVTSFTNRLYNPASMRERGSR